MKVLISKFNKYPFRKPQKCNDERFCVRSFFNADVPGSEKVIKNFSNLLPAVASSSINDDSKICTYIRSDHLTSIAQLRVTMNIAANFA